MLLENIFVVRRDVDLARQGSLPGLRSLYDTVPGKGMPHPYALGEKQREALAAAVESFGSCCSSWHGAADGEYLYRMCSIGTLIWHVARSWYDYKSDSQAFRELEKKSGGKWVNLRRFTGAELSNYRGFSWWTTLDLSSTEPWNAWRRIGLLDDWVMEQTVLLRCRSEDVSAITRVPTAIDGFEGPIFEAVDEEPTPLAGIAIDLSDSPYRRGAPEFVLTSVPPEAIEVRPLEVDESIKTNGIPARNDADTWQRLYQYYTALLAP